MARYDSPGAGDRTPAGPVTQSTGAGQGSAITPGSRLTPQDAEALAPVGELLGIANLTGLTGGSVSEDVPQIMAEVHGNDVLVPSQVLAYARDPVTGVHPGREEPSGRVITPVHPSAAAGSGAGAPS